VCYADLSKVTHLDLSGNRLTELPPSLDKMVNLQFIDLSNNQLESLPRSILTFSHLKSIVLHDNKFAHAVNGDAQIEHNDLPSMESWLFEKGS
jgi:Leucine-rich repeat (LRR) protein